MTPTTVDLARRADCTDPRAGRPFRGQRGDLLVRCRACGVMRVLPEATVQARAEPVEPEPGDVIEVPAEVEPEPVSRWWCREHLAPCDHRGRGCTECPATRA